jgi:hypothetical protein
MEDYMSDSPDGRCPDCGRVECCKHDILSNPDCSERDAAWCQLDCAEKRIVNLLTQNANLVATLMHLEPLDIVFDGPPEALSGRFIEVENMAGASVNIGTWIKRNDGYWALRIPCHYDLMMRVRELEAELSALKGGRDG